MQLSIFGLLVAACCMFWVQCIIMCIMRQYVVNLSGKGLFQQILGTWRYALYALSHAGVLTA